MDNDALFAAVRAYAHSLLEPFRIEDVLYPLSDRIAEALEADGAGLCLLREERLVFLTATNEHVAAVDEAQSALADGPCYEALRLGEPVLSADLTTDHPYPEFARILTGAGFRAHLAVPLPSTGEHLGVATIYRGQPDPWTREDVEAAQLLTDIAGGYLLNARSLQAARQEGNQLQRALESRVVIEQAKGVLSQRHGIDVSRVFGLLRSHARNQRRPLHEVAREVVAGELDL